jgi:5-methylthioadenosine/S-adenosylhomocysteine deaminase
VRDVWVAGEQVLADGVPARVDPGEVLAGARRVAAKVKA